MSEAKHTPGPYMSYHMAVSDNLSPGAGFSVQAVVSAGGVEICRMTPAASQSDVALFVAAPALLAAAKRILANLNQRIDAAPGNAKPVFDGIEDLHTAINLAEERAATHTPDNR